MTAIGHAPASATAGVENAILLRELGRQWKKLAGAALLGGAVGAALSFAITPTFTATNVFLPPAQQQGGASAMLASLGSLSNLVGGGSATRNSADQYIALMQSTTVADHIIKKFDLLTVYDTRYLESGRKKLAKRVQMTSGKKDGLIRVEVDDTSAARAAAIANQYVDELRQLTNTLAVSEAQQRRVFFEHLLEQTRDKLAAAQTQLEASGINSGTLKSDPKTAAEGYAKLRADLTVANVKLQVLRSTLADSSPEVRQQLEAVSALTGQMQRLEVQEGSSGTKSSDYVNRYREFKYQETLFDLFARQYEAARVDESREGALIQVVDPATPPELKSAPQRSLVTLAGALIALLGTAAFLYMRRFNQLDPASAGSLRPEA